MNVHGLFRTIKENYHRLKDQDFALRFLQYHIELLAGKRQKLKLGAIIFEIKETTFCGVTLMEDIDIRYIRQDNTETDELKLENRLKAIGGKGDTKNVIALGVVIFGFLCEIYTYIDYGYKKYLPTLAFRADHFDYILKFGFEQTFVPSHVGVLGKGFSANYGLIDLFTDFCVYFNIIF